MVERLLTDEKLFECFQEQGIKLIETMKYAEELVASDNDHNELDDAVMKTCDIMIDYAKLGKEIADRKLAWEYMNWRDGSDRDDGRKV